MTSVSPTTQTVQLSPSYNLPIALAIIAIPVLLVQAWLSLILSLFAGFLLFQAATLRLYFTETALDIYRSQQLIRRFPYTDWLNWQVYWPGIPILFYFKEIKSIHFLPILFNPKTLQACLEARCPRTEAEHS